MKLLKIFSLIIIALAILHAEPSKKDTSDIEKEIRASETIEKQKETINALEKRITLLEQNNSLQQENMLIKKESLDKAVSWAIMMISGFGTVLLLFGGFLVWVGLGTKKEIREELKEVGTMEYSKISTELKSELFDYKESLKIQILKDVESEIERRFEMGRSDIVTNNGTPTGGNPNPFERNQQ